MTMMTMTPVRRLGEEGARAGALDHDPRADEQARTDTPPMAIIMS
jgi:hypothetical protein